MPPVPSGFFSFFRWLFSVSWVGYVFVLGIFSSLCLFFSWCFLNLIVCIFLKLQMQYWALRAAVVLIFSDWIQRKSCREVILPPAVFAGVTILLPFSHVYLQTFQRGPLCMCDMLGSFQPNDMFVRKFWKHIRYLVFFLDSDVPVSSHFLAKSVDLQYNDLLSASHFNMLLFSLSLYLCLLSCGLGTQFAQCFCFYAVFAYSTFPF